MFPSAAEEKGFGELYVGGYGDKCPSADYLLQILPQAWSGCGVNDFETFWSIAHGEGTPPRSGSAKVDWSQTCLDSYFPLAYYLYGLEDLLHLSGLQSL